MSTFTDWNGPQGSNVKTSDLVSLVKAYEDMLATLNAHLSHTASSDNVHNVKDYVTAEIAAVKALIPSLTSYMTTSAADAKYATNASLSQLQATVNDKASTSALALKADKADLDAYVKKSELSEQEVITTIQAAITALEAALAAGQFTALDVTTLTASGVIKGYLASIKTIVIENVDITAASGGTDTDGKYYLLGAITEGAGSAFIKYTNGTPFTANVMYALTEAHDTTSAAAELTVVTDAAISGLKFKVVKGTDSKSHVHYYLAIQNPAWGAVVTVDFNVTGINFIPANSDEYVIPNGACEDLTDCLAYKGLSFSTLGTRILGQIYKTADDPYVTSSELQSNIPVGAIVQWNKYNDEGVATDVPAGFLACDGTKVPAGYAELKALIGDTLPLIDCNIIKAGVSSE